jgi:twinkle protein
VVITEGEIDRMSVSQAFDNKYPTGSLPNGSGSVKKAILADYEKLCAFDSIYLCFDNDEPGQKALKEACELLPVGKVKIMTVPHKDANETLLKSGPAPIVRAYWDAKAFQPDGIREGREFTRERLKSKRAKGYRMPWPKLDAMWLGSRDGELTTICAGSGIGKTTIVRDLAYAMRMDHDMKIGNIYLEEDNDTSAKAYCALHAGVPLKQVLNDPDSVSDEAWDAALAAVIHDGMLFYDHFGSLESERLMTMMRYMAASGCKHRAGPYLDCHLRSGERQRGRAQGHRHPDDQAGVLREGDRLQRLRHRPSQADEERLQRRRPDQPQRHAWLGCHRAAVVQRAGGRA